MDYKFFVGFLVITFSREKFVKALQCYVCENCQDGTELQTMQICGELPFETTVRPPVPSSSAAAPLLTPQSSSAATTSRPGSSGSNSRPPATTSSRPQTTKKEDSDEDYEYEDSDERRRRNWMRQGNLLSLTSFKQDQPVCYMLIYRVNGTQVANLGCTSMVNQNYYQTCNSLSLNNITIEDCKLCSANGCNKFDSVNDYGDPEYPPWASSGKNLQFTLLNCFFFVLLKQFFV